MQLKNIPLKSVFGMIKSDTRKPVTVRDMDKAIAQKFKRKYQRNK